MIINERNNRSERLLHVANEMMTAARTAPKGKGVDIIEIAMVTDGNINILSEMMVKMVAEHGMKFFLRDAENLNRPDKATGEGFGVQQNRLMTQRVLFQAVAVLLIVLIGALAGSK